MGPMMVSVPVRMSMAVLDELSEAAKLHGWSLDEEIAARLTGSLDIPRAHDKP